LLDALRSVGEDRLATIAYARPPKRTRRKPKVPAKPVATVVDRRQPPPPYDRQASGEAADRLWRELIRRASES
jgi:hypothetical protein